MKYLTQEEESSGYMTESKSRDTNNLQIIIKVQKLDDVGSSNKNVFKCLHLRVNMYRIKKLCK